MRWQVLCGCLSVCCYVFVCWQGFSEGLLPTINLFFCLSVSFSFYLFFLANLRLLSSSSSQLSERARMMSIWTTCGKTPLILLLSSSKTIQAKNHWHSIQSFGSFPSLYHQFHKAVSSSSPPPGIFVVQVLDPSVPALEFCSSMCWIWMENLCLRSNME